MIKEFAAFKTDLYFCEIQLIYFGYILCFADELRIVYSKSPRTNRCTVIPKGMHRIIDVYHYLK